MYENQEKDRFHAEKSDMLKKCDEASAILLESEEKALKLNEREGNKKMIFFFEHAIYHRQKVI